MAVESVELSGDALLGVGSHLCAAGLMEQLPKKVCLGRNRPAARPSVLRLASYFNSAIATGNLPDAVDWYTKAAPAIARMYLNDQYGNCVIAGKAHNFGVWSANDIDSGGIITATDQEILQQYHKFCGPGDNGCNISNVLDQIRAGGFVMGGKTYYIDGYVSVDWTNQPLVKASLVLTGAATIGINLPSAWTNSAVWDITNSRIVGGHDVSPVGYDSKGVYVSSWGRIYQITWRAFVRTRWVDEMYAMLSPTWYGNDKLAPCGIDADTLKADLQKLSSGTMPDLEPDAPPPSPGDFWV